jgi:uncharacterized membrane protein
MMYGYGFGSGWMWFGGIVLVLILAALIVLIVRLFIVGGSPRAARGHAGTSSARQIAEERLARGEITPDEFGQITRALEQRT